MPSLGVCVAHVLGVDPSDVPSGGIDELGPWLATRGLGLVPVAHPGSFAWPGRFLGRSPGGGWSVMFGVPPGPVLGEAGELVEAFALADHELRFRPPRGPSSAVGRVTAIAVAPAAEAAMMVRDEVRAYAGRGLEGDRYAAGAGTFSGGAGGGRDLTLIEEEALAELRRSGPDLALSDARRNLVVSQIALDGLLDRRFRVGGVECRGRRRCEPCAHLERLTRPGVLRGLVHRGGLRADILTDGTIRVGDEVRPL